MESFILSGKAKNVFHLIELAAKRETANQMTIREVRKTGPLCPFDPEQQARCNINDPCGKMGCMVWLEALEKSHREMQGL